MVAKQATAYRKPSDLGLGNVTWIKVDASRWWPGQIVDEKTNNKNSKPKKKIAGKILVRLYGSYDYLYINPEGCGSEFENVLQQNNGDLRAIFLNSLEAASRKNFSPKSKGKGLASKEIASKEEITCKQVKKDKGIASQKECLTSARESNSNTRRMKVMQSLGFAAPLGSPFKNGLSDASHRRKK